MNVQTHSKILRRGRSARAGAWKMSGARRGRDKQKLTARIAFGALLQAGGSVGGCRHRPAKPTTTSALMTTSVSSVRALFPSFPGAPRASDGARLPKVSLGSKSSSPKLRAASRSF